MKLSIRAFASLLLLIITFAAHAQDYSLIRPNDTLFFQHFNSAPNKFALGIDSSAVIGTDTFFYLTNTLPSPETSIVPIPKDSPKSEKTPLEDGPETKILALRRPR